MYSVQEEPIYWPSTHLQKAPDGNFTYAWTDWQQVEGGVSDLA